MLTSISDEQIAPVLSDPAVTASVEKALESLAHGRAAIKARWREAANDVAVFKTAGMGLTDWATAAVVWQHWGAA